MGGHMGKLQQNSATGVCDILSCLSMELLEGGNT